MLDRLTTATKQLGVFGCARGFAVSWARFRKGDSSAILHPLPGRLENEPRVG